MRRQPFEWHRNKDVCVCVWLCVLGGGCQAAVLCVTWGAVLCCHAHIISSFKCLTQPHGMIFTFKAVENLGLCRFLFFYIVRAEPVLVSSQTLLLSENQPYLQRSARLGTTVEREGGRRDGGCSGSNMRRGMKFWHATLGCYWCFTWRPFCRHDWESCLIKHGFFPLPWKYVSWFK